MAKSIMIQGTMSGAGKSVLAAGLCRLFHQDGRRVAPFKAQNMALNSFVTAEGLEIGRSQAMQAEAAGIAPSARMNPVLLKPTGDTGCQVVARGEVYAQMTARQYMRKKSALMPQVMDCYAELCEQNDIVVLEGAGSPAEINLRQGDIVNMGMAHRAHAPVLLVGDINPGGVFAQLYGTVALLEPEDRAMIRGVIINKFRGDKGILQPGIRRLEELLGLPVLGVVPYERLDLDEEDSLAPRLSATATGRIDLAVIRLPRLSNFTDFQVFERFEGVSVRYVDSPRRLGEPDLIVLPGTKNTMADLRWLRKSGLADAVCRHAQAGGTLFGICGGYQMLGRRLSDPLGVEGGGSLPGLGLLPTDTVFSPTKARRQVKGRFQRLEGALAALSNLAFSGYEIHMGRTPSGPPLSALSDAAHGSLRPDGCQCGSVYGSYVHGLFDEDNVAKTLLSALAQRKGVAAPQALTLPGRAHRQQQYDQLADTLRRHLDISRIYRILEDGI